MCRLLIDWQNIGDKPVGTRVHTYRSLIDIPDILHLIK